MLKFQQLEMSLTTVILLLICCAAWTTGIQAGEMPSSSSFSGPRTFTIRLPGSNMETDWDDEEGEGGSIVGSGREWSIFESRGGSSIDGDGNSNKRPNSSDDYLVERYRRQNLSRYTSSGSRSTGSSNNNNKKKRWRRKRQQQSPKVIQTVQDWWSTSVAPQMKDLPKIVCRVEPTTTLKLRKTIRPLKTIVRIGADFNTQLGVWQFKSSWEDAIIGGKLVLAGKELQLTKSWQLSLGAVEDLVTRLRFRAAINLQTFQAYARVGFRTERLSPINVMEGFTIYRRLPLDGNKGNIKMEVKSNIALPEPEIEYSTDVQRRLIGMGDIEVSVDELNLVLDY